MRDLYLSKLNAKTYLQANPKDVGLKPFLNLDLALPSDGKYLKYPEDYQLMPGDNVTPICCNLLLTNETHDGIWLLSNWKKGIITIPSKNINEYHLLNLECGRPESAIINTITDVIVDTDDPLVSAIRYNDGPRYILRGYGFECKYPEELFYYNFYTELETKYNIFMVIESDRPSRPIPTLSDFNIDGFIWYSKNDHQINMKNYYNKNSLFDSRGYQYDVRTDDFGVALLDQIFRTENLFGKLDIY